MKSKALVCHTLLASVRRALRGQAVGEADVLALFQLAIVLIFFDEVLAHGFESEKVARDSQDSIRELEENGIGAGIVRIMPGTPDSFLRTSTSAADRLADFFPGWRPSPDPQLIGTRPELGRQQQLSEDELTQLMNDGCSSSHRIRRVERSARMGAVRVTERMLLINKALEAAVLNKARRFTLESHDVSEFIVYSRIFWNNEIGLESNAIYIPPVSRSMLLERQGATLQQLQVLHQIARTIAHISFQPSIALLLPTQHAQFLAAPSVAAAVNASSHGSLRGMMKAIMEHRSRTRKLRRFTANVLRLLATRSGVGAHQSLAMLARCMNPGGQPMLVDGLQVGIGSSGVQLSVKKFWEWWLARAVAGCACELMELAAPLHFQNINFAANYTRIQEECYRNAA